MNIAIGSTNPVKCNATCAVLTPLYPGAAFITVDVPSGVASQPWGDIETRTGALNRARSALAQTGAALGVGLEGGVQDTEFGLMTCAWGVIIDAHQRIGVGGSACMLLPPAIASQLHQGIELGAAMDQLANQSNTRHCGGAIGILTGSLETRQSAFETILRLALARFRTPAFYPGQTPIEHLKTVGISNKRGKS